MYRVATLDSPLLEKLAMTLRIVRGYGGWDEFWRDNLSVLPIFGMLGESGRSWTDNQAVSSIFGGLGRVGRERQ